MADRCARGIQSDGPKGVRTGRHAAGLVSAYQRGQPRGWPPTIRPPPPYWHCIWSAPCLGCTRKDHRYLSITEENSLGACGTSTAGPFIGCYLRNNCQEKVFFIQPPHYCPSQTIDDRKIRIFVKTCLWAFGCFWCYFLKPKKRPLCDPYTTQIPKSNMVHMEAKQAHTGGMFARRAPGALLLDYVPPEEPPSTPLGNALRIR